MPTLPLPARAALLLPLLLGGCASGGDPAPPRGPDQRAEYAALADTTVCVVDRASARGLRSLPAKRAADGRAVLLVEDRIQPLDQVHPVSMIAGYAGAESWYRAGDPVSLDGRRYLPVEGERMIGADQLHLYDEVGGVPVFADPRDDPPPEAVYAPVRPGCIFHAYVREDLMEGP